MCQPADFYPRSPCGERLHYDNYNLHCVEISIHALLAESDGGSGVGNWPRVIFLSTLSLRRATALIHWKHSKFWHFYPRSPCGERHTGSNESSEHTKFLSTLSLRRATLIQLRKLLYPGNFYPRSPCGERQRSRHWRADPTAISIHALLAESDLDRPPPLAGGTISIHALLAESDFAVGR